jgi:hypothetical protein
MRGLIDRSNEIAARHLGQRRGIRFRKYDRWGSWPIKAYGPGLAGDNAPDFRTWKEAYDWIRGEAEG